MNSPHQIIMMSVLLLLSASAGIAQQQGYVSPAGTKFLLYTPPGYYSSTSSYPLLLSLHGEGEMGDDLAELTSKNSTQMPCRLIYLNKWPQHLPFLVLTPQLKPDEGDQDPIWGPQWPTAYVDEVVRYVTSNYRVDPRRIYVTGLSKGAIGSWNYAAAYPDKVAALMPISGRSDLTKACAVKNIPAWVFHGDNDGRVIPAYSINMVNAINACQPPGIYKPHLTILNVRNHNGWNEVYNGTSGYKVYEWLLMFRKNDTSNKIPYVNAGPDRRIPLRNEPLHVKGDFFDADGNIINVTWKQTGGTPLLALSNTGSNFLKISELKTGIYEFELTVTDDKGLQNSDRVVIEITNTSVSPVITNLVLYNGKTDAEITNLSEGQVINTTALGFSEINIKAIANSGTASVVFSVNADQNTRTQNAGPYFIKNQTTYPEWNINNGEYLICATPYPLTNARGNPGGSLCYKIEVTDGLCQASGRIWQELWTGIRGTLISSIPLNSPSSSTIELTMFEGQSNVADNYGSRMRGFICPPASGDYTFWISGNDRTELWLSTDANPANKRRIAYAGGYTNVRQWTKYPSQQSVPVNLSAYQKYYIEALHKEGVGTDHVAVGWQLPNGTLERPIPGIRLSPFNTSGKASAQRTIARQLPPDSITNEQRNAEELTIFPNPAQTGFRQLIIKPQKGDNSGSPVIVEIVTMTGEVLHRQHFPDNKTSDEYLSILMGKELKPGLYLVILTAKERRFSRRLLVK